MATSTTRRRRATAGEDWLTPPQVAKQLGVKPEKVRAWIERGDLVAVNLAENASGRPTWRIARVELDKFLALRQSRPALKIVRRPRRSPLPIKQYI